MHSKLWATVDKGLWVTGPGGVWPSRPGWPGGVGPGLKGRRNGSPANIFIFILREIN